MLFHQAHIALGLFEKVQVLALQVFNERNHGAVFINGRLNNGLDMREAGAAHGAPSAFSRNNFIIILAELANGDGLKKTITA